MKRYFEQDIPQLHQKMSNVLPRVYDLSNQHQNAAFLALAQHHGYPTPLLDWTTSPFVAAFFAFNGINDSNAADRLVRIYIFDYEEWGRLSQLENLENGLLHVSALHPMAYDNPRLLRQQALSTMTNVADIESYFSKVEKVKKTKYLQAYDIPAMYWTQAKRELALMGITPGSLFPGLDGICQELQSDRFPTFSPDKKKPT